MIKSEEVRYVCHSMTVTDRVSTILICFHGKKGEDLYGEILNCYVDKPLRFFNIGDLILKLDEICDWVGTPHPSADPRFLNKKMAEQYIFRTMGRNKIPLKANIQLQDIKTLSSRAIRAKETLMVKIEHRQNASMQGRVMGRLTSKKYVGFRSALELMRMIREIAIRTERTES
ncbi:hypothetical protein AALB39_05960 [Lachnospiraceae bacterium 54-53]